MYYRSLENCRYSVVDESHLLTGLELSELPTGGRERQKAMAWDHPRPHGRLRRWRPRPCRGLGTEAVARLRRAGSAVRQRRRALEVSLAAVGFPIEAFALLRELGFSCASGGEARGRSRGVR